jgi:guanylate kinase
MTPAEFKARVAGGEFLEYATVHNNFYGTLKATVRSAMDAGKSVLMDIDVQGAEQVRSVLQEMPADDVMVRGFVDIFVQPPSMEELRRRLESRGEDAPEVIERRLANAEAEMARAGEYRYQIVNDDLERAVAEMNAVVDCGGDV